MIQGREGQGREAGDGTHTSQPSGTVWSRPRMLRPARLPPCPPGAVPPAAVDSSPFVSCPLRFGPNPAAPSRCEDEAARRGQEPASLYGDRGQWAAGSAQVPGSLVTRATHPHPAGLIAPSSGLGDIVLSRETALMTVCLGVEGAHLFHLYGNALPRRLLF